MHRRFGFIVFPPIPLMMASPAQLSHFEVFTSINMTVSTYLLMSINILFPAPPALFDIIWTSEIIFFWTSDYLLLLIATILETFVLDFFLWIFHKLESKLNSKAASIELSVVPIVTVGLKIYGLIFWAEFILYGCPIIPTIGLF